MQDTEDQEFISSVVKNYIGGICVFRIDSVSRKITPEYINDGFFRMIRTDKKKLEKLLADPRLSIVPEDIQLVEQGIDDILADNGSVEFEFRVVSLDGDIMWLRFRGNLYSREGSVNLVSGVLLDCTEQKTIEEELQRQWNYMNLLLDTDVTFDYNCRTDVMTFKFSEGEILGREEVIKDYVVNIDSSRIHPEDLKRYKEMFESAMKTPHRDFLEYRYQPEQNAEYRWYSVNIISIIGAEGYVSHVIGRISDIHEVKIKEMELKLRADRDSLTGLMNKAATGDLIESILSKYGEHKKQGALFMIDVDDFKNVNDTYGHAAGDAVLETVGHILLQNFKGMDVTGRIGGDEFMVYMHGIRHTDDALLMAERIKELLASSFEGSPMQGDVSVSMGISVCPDHGTTFKSLYEYADRALYTVKRGGKGKFRLYDPGEDNSSPK